MIKECLVCGKQFTTYRSKILLGRGKYCSPQCCLSRTAFKEHSKPWDKGIKRLEIMGEKHPRWKGFRLCGRHNNYREIRINGEYIREHRLVMEKYLGRKLKHGEEIHHIDGNGLNNKIENLKLMQNKHKHLQLEHSLGRYKNNLMKLHGTRNKVFRVGKFSR